MRSDTIGMFWEDLPRKGKDRIARVMPAIPDTGWTTPTEFPNLGGARALCIDVETKDRNLEKKGPGWARHDGHIVGLAVGTDDGWRRYFPMRHEVEPQYNLDPEHVLSWARDQLSNPRQPKIGANIPYDVGWLREEGVYVQGALHDVQFAEALLAEALTVNLDDLGERYLGRGKTGHQLYEWCSQYYGGPETDKQRANIYRAPPRLVGPYAEGDVDIPFGVIHHQWGKMHNEGLLDLYEMECRLIPLLIEMRFAGVRVNLEHAEEMLKYLTKEIEDIDKQVEDMVGFPVNTAAAASMAEAFDRMGLPYGHTPKGSPSFKAGFLATVEHPLADLVLTHKQRTKLRDTFVKGYVLNSHVGGRLYGTFNQLRSDGGGARSGRFSSSDPNLQNIPFRSKTGKEIRKAFVPDYGHKQWRKYDYCVSPDTRILTSDLHWKQARFIKTGDQVVAFDEDSNPRRYMHSSRVVATKVLTQPCYRIKTNKTEIICSARHRWLAQTYTRTYAVPSQWKQTSELKVGHRIIRCVDSWDTPTMDHELGWLAGFFDGEGYFSNSIVGASQNAGLCYDRVKELLTKHGFEYEETLSSQKDNLWNLRLIGGRSATWRFLGTVRPLRLLDKIVDVGINDRTVTCWEPADIIEEIEYLGEQSVIGIETEHKTFIAEGLCSHNSQIEYRGLAHYAVGPGSEDVRRRYNLDPTTDFHVMVQAIIQEVVGLDLDRPSVKTINFGTAYGMGERKLARSLNLSKSEAKQLMEAIHRGAPFLKSTMEYTMQEAAHFGYITTILGRRSRFDLWVPEKYNEEAIPLPWDKAILSYRNPQRAYLHKALNRRLQGSAADLIKKAMLMCWEGGVFAETGVPRLTVHDELDFSDPGTAESDKAFVEMQHIMETAIQFNVPIKVDCEVGPSWGELQAVA